MNHVPQPLKTAVILLLCYLVPVAIMFKIKPVWRFDDYTPVLLVATLIGIVVARLLAIPPRNLGFAFNKDSDSPVYALVTLGIAGILLAAYYAGLIPQNFQGFDQEFFIKYVLISAPIQEFLFRCLPIALLERSHVPAPATVLVSAGLFGTIHILTGSWITVLITASIGVVWGMLFLRYRTWYSVTLSHAVLGFAAILIGLI